MGWVLFKAESFTHAFAYYKSLAGLYDAELKIPVVNLNWLGGDVDAALFFGIIFATPLYSYCKLIIQQNRDRIPHILYNTSYFIYDSSLIGMFFFMCLSYLWRKL